MEVSDYIGFVSSEGDRFARVAEQGALDVAIDPCPGWDMRELVRHVGLIHLWAAANVAFPQPGWLKVSDLSDLTQRWPDLASEWPDNAGLVPWYRATHANLVRVLESTPADHECFTFLPAPSPLAMWARRQASEIAVHRFDAESARGIPTKFEPRFAADMLDELLSGFAPRSMDLAVAADNVLHVHADDVGEHWYLTIGPKGIRSSREGDRADLTVSGTAADLYLLLWNRTPPSNAVLDGDSGVMDLWRESCRVRWLG